MTTEPELGIAIIEREDGIFVGVDAARLPELRVAARKQRRTKNQTKRRKRSQAATAAQKGHVLAIQRSKRITRLAKHIETKHPGKSGRQLAKSMLHAESELLSVLERHAADHPIDTSDTVIRLGG